jgi:hypothetical protein
LGHDVVRAIFHAQPISEEELERATETELTRAARGSVDNASQIISSSLEFGADDFDNKQAAQPKKKQTEVRKKARKTERKRKTAAKRRKK